jgi:hypothetical protein
LNVLINYLCFELYEDGISFVNFFDDENGTWSESVGDGGKHH